MRGGSPSTLPKYQRHQSGQARVRVAGRDYYLGTYGSEDSHEQYHRLLGEWVSAGRPSPWVGPLGLRKEVAGSVGPVTVADLMLQYVRHADVYYRKDGVRTSEYDAIRCALRPVYSLFRSLPVAEFGPRALHLCREQMVASGLGRSTVNAYVAKVKRMFQWGVELELVPPEVGHGLCAVRGLKRGRTQAPESRPVEPVSEADVAAVLPFVSAPVAAMIQLQLLTGMRPGEVCAMRGEEVRTQGDLWTYVPGHHKTEHHGRSREVALGPKAQELLRPFLRERICGPLFRPEAAEVVRQAKRRAERKTPLLPKDERRGRGADRRRAPGEAYSVDSYRRAIARACKKAEIPTWSPNQLRHRAATDIRREYGLEASRSVLGHSSAVTTEIYAERDHQAAARIALERG